MPDPGHLVYAALTAFALGGVCFLAAGITCLAHALRRTRHRDQET